MYRLRSEFEKFKPKNLREIYLLLIIKRLAQTIGFFQNQERTWGPAHQAISEALLGMKELNRPPEPPVKQNPS